MQKKEKNPNYADEQRHAADIDSSSKLMKKCKRGTPMYVYMQTDA